MPISAGTRLGPYEILAPIGAGGMGEVYKARDTRLDRIVAIKVSQERFSDRFQREARAIAALNHTHICTLHDVGPDYIVMEYLEGKPIKGPLPLAKSLDYAAQICDALDAAHRKGIVHRDLKPSNILVTKQGVKVVDFGLAKTRGEETQTQTGVRVGTPSYMAPEQWDGRDVDARTDIFALGHVLYEMVTGNRAVHTPLDLPTLDRVVQTCIAPDPEERWQSAREVKLALQLVSVPAAAAVPSVAWRWTAAALAVLCAGALAWIVLQPHLPVAQPIRLSLDPPVAGNFTEFGFALSPDGRTLAFVAEVDGKQSLWTRQLDSLVAQEIPRTRAATYPFWSPDSKSLGFFQLGKLKRVALAGGVPTNVCDALDTRGGSWGADGVIVFAPVAGGGLQRVSAGGGKPEYLTRLDAGRTETEHRWPRFLPDGKQFLYWVQSSNTDDTGVYITNVATAVASVRIMASERLAEYAPSAHGDPGFLVWVRGESLLAQRFDPQRRRLTGEPATISDLVALTSLGYAHFSAPEAGALIYGTTSFGQRRMQWRSRNGKVISEEGPADVYYSPHLSRDGSRVAIVRVSSAVNADVWVYEFARGIMTRLTFEPGVDNYPVWSPDGLQVAFTGARGGPRSLFLTDARGDRMESRLTNAAYNQELLDWSSDGRYLVYRENHPVSHSDLYLLPMRPPPSERKPLPFVKTMFDETEAKFSPDARWVAYVSNESGDYEVYVRSIEEAVRFPVSNHGGSSPLWRRDGKELFYISRERVLMSVDVAVDGGSLHFSAPRELFPIPHRPSVSTTEYDISADGQRFLVLAPTNKVAPLNVVLNWQTILKRH